MRYNKKPKPTTKSLTIVYDDREKLPWMFLSKNWTMKKTRLKVGDYSFKGFEDKVAIEKKSGLAELFTDLTAKNRPRFKRFLKKLSQYPIKCIIVEDELINLYSVWTVMKKKAPRTRLTPLTILYWIGKITVVYKIPILFVSKGWTHRIGTRHIFEAAQKEVQEL